MRSSLRRSVHAVWAAVSHGSAFLTKRGADSPATIHCFSGGDRHGCAWWQHRRCDGV